MLDALCPVALEIFVMKCSILPQIKAISIFANRVFVLKHKILRPKVSLWTGTIPAYAEFISRRWSLFKWGLYSLSFI